MSSLCTVSLSKNCSGLALACSSSWQQAAVTADLLSHYPSQKRLSHTSPSQTLTADGVTVKPFSAMPGPRGVPGVGTLFDFVGPMKKKGFKFNKMFEVMKIRADKYGPIYREQIGNLASVVVSDPREYAKVIRADGKFPNRIELEPMKYYRQQRGMSLGTVNSQGEEWYRHRTILSKKMLRPKEILDYIEPMNGVANDLTKHLATVRDPHTGLVVDLAGKLFIWSLETIGEFLFEERIGGFGNPPSKQAQDFIHNLLMFFKLLQPLMYNPPFYKLYRTATWRQFEGYSDRVIAIGQQYVNKKVEALMRQALKGVQEGEQVEKSEFITYLLTQKMLTPQEANSHAVDMMMGGVETTTNATLWTLYLLSKNPEAQETLYKEITSVLPDNGDITADILTTRLQYVKACLKETLRLFPITFATSRMIPGDLEICGYHVPANSHVQANLYGMGRDSRIFADPLKFRPERWLRGDVGDESLMAMASLPFGHGARMCIGRRLAEQEIYIGLTKIIQNFKLEYAGHEDVQPVLHTVMTPDRPVHIKFTPRTARF